MRSFRTMGDLFGQAEDLKKLGLTEYQAKALLALMAMGAGTPREVAIRSGIPYPSAYDSLRSLTDKGWIEAASTRPVIFRAREPKLMKEKINEDLEKLFVNLERQYEKIRGENSKLQLIYTIIGMEQVRSKLLEMLRSAKVDVFLVMPSSTLRSIENDEIRSFFTQYGDALNLRILTDDKISDIRGANIRFRQSVLAVDLLVDHSKALIALPDLSACGWIDSITIASHFGQFLELLWQDSKMYKSSGKKLRLGISTNGR